MANPDHLKILKQGVEVWNQWRAENPEVVPDLEDADLRGIKCEVIDFRKARLCGANLQRGNLTLAQLQKANLRGTELQETDFTLANLQEADLGGALLQNATFTLAQLEKATLSGADLQNVDFQNANLSGADIQWANLSKVSCKNIIYDSHMKCRGVIIEDSVGGKLFTRHVRDLDYLAEYKDAHKWWYSIWKISCNCGRSIWLWGLWAFCIAMLLGGILDISRHLPEWFPGTIHEDFIPQMDYTHMEEGWLTPYYFSIVTFTTLGFGDIIPKNSAGQLFLICEVVLGYFMLGGLITLFATKLVRQS